MKGIKYIQLGLTDDLTIPLLLNVMNDTKLFLFVLDDEYWLEQAISHYLKDKDLSYNVLLSYINALEESKSND